MDIEIDQQAMADLGGKLVNLSKNAILTVDYNGYGPANASGRAVSSLVFRVTARGVDLISQGESARYIMTLVHGRGPTKSAGSGALRPRIREWLDQKGIGNESEREGMSYAITKSIHKKGTTLYQRGGNSPIFDALTGDEVRQEAIAAVKFGILRLIKGWVKPV